MKESRENKSVKKKKKKEKTFPKVFIITIEFFFTVLETTKFL